MSLVKLLGTLVTPTALVAALWMAVRANQSRRIAEADLTRVSGGLLKMLEAERTRIARELHDDISQQLAVVALELNALTSLPSNAPAELQPAIATLAERVRSVAADVQHVTRGLHPIRLEYLGLVPAVQALAHDMEHYGLRIDVSATNWPAELPAVVALSLYRVTQEALHNAAKHSGTDAVRVTFQGSETSLRLTVSDAGVGFEPQGMDTANGFGLMSMRQRMRGIGGTLSVHSIPGRGARIQALLPRSMSLPDLEPAVTEPEKSSITPVPELA
jgi:signal transduction histidine kinase